MVRGNVVKWENNYYVVSGVTNKGSDEKLYGLLSFNTPRTSVAISNRLSSKLHIAQVVFISHSINDFIVEKLTSMFYGKE